MTDVLLALIGTRRRIPSVLSDITSTMELLDRDTIIVTGDAPGVDLHVKRECKRLGFRFIECHARWGTHGLGAGPERNTVIARLAHKVIAWPATPKEDREHSKGSWNCIEQFESRGKEAVVRETAWRAV